MKYEIAWHNSLEALEEEVREKIRAGWVPQGGVSVSLQWDDDTNTNYIYCYQAMVMESADA